MFDGSKPNGQTTDIFHNYLQFVKETEPPIIYHRWAYLTCLGAVIGRKAFLDMGLIGRYFPNIYAMFLGEPSARKTVAILIAKRLLAASGYTTFAANKTTEAKFLLDLEGITEDAEINPNGANTKATKTGYDLVTAENLWGGTEGEPREVFIVADEFNNFAGPGNLDFYTTLGDLWDFDDPQHAFSQRLKNSKSVSIYQPTVSILAGNTPELFARAFPPEAIGSGFLARLLLIHGERSERRITFPPPPDAILQETLVNFLRKLSSTNFGELGKSPEAIQLLDDIYQNNGGEVITDIRFKAYNNRRFKHLLKLCIIFAVAKFQKEITDEDVIQANTILSHAEMLMPKAMGEFGKNKNSDVANKIINVIDKALKPISTREIWAGIGAVSTLPSIKDLLDLLNGLQTADRIQLVSVGTHHGYLPKKAPKLQPKHVDWSFLTQEERDML